MTRGSDRTRVKRRTYELKRTWEALHVVPDQGPEAEADLLVHAGAELRLLIRQSEKAAVTHGQGQGPYPAPGLAHENGSL